MSYAKALAAYALALALGFGALWIGFHISDAAVMRKEQPSTPVGAE